ncbi:MAG: DUF4145 domain-containing protein, partial [candidate division Zixibacteria bacterium]|nr:DUF4145 domain-containing protein [candidate division Zixibacteria bacterium]
MYVADESAILLAVAGDVSLLSYGTLQGVKKMKCPYCFVAISAEEMEANALEQDDRGHWFSYYRKCPECDKLIVMLFCYESANYVGHDYQFGRITEEIMALPRGSSRPPCPPGVPANLRDDYTESALVLPDSPKASAALSRRCLQSLLRDRCKVKPAKSLDSEIQELLDRNELPTYIAKSLDAIRNVGN